MQLSTTYIVMSHGEDSVFPLIDLLKANKGQDDKVWVLDDPTTEDYTKKLKATGAYVLSHKLDHDYSAHRNFAVEKVKTDYLFMIDADEQPCLFLMQNLRQILLQNKLPDGVWCPRLNLFKNVKPIHALMYGWTLQGEVVNWPDPQCRIVRNRKGIRWVGALHERPKLTKEHKILQLPADKNFAIIHNKTIEKQLKDNEHYNKEFSYEENAGKATMEILTNG